MSGWVQYVTGGGGLLALVGVVWTVVKDIKGGGLRRSNAEASQEEMTAEQMRHAAPLVQQALALGQVGEAVSIQQQFINTLGSELDRANQRLADKDKQIADLEKRIRERDRRIDELEKRLGVAEENVAEARKIIDGLRNNPDHTAPQ